MADPVDQENAVDLGQPEDVVQFVPPTEDWNPEPARESIRGILAIAAMALLAAIVIGTFLMIVWVTSGTTTTPDAAALEPVKTVLELLLTPIVAIVGSVTGFYFGGQAQKSK